jgi:hypothetical protein
VPAEAATTLVPLVRVERSLSAHYSFQMRQNPAWRLELVSFRGVLPRSELAVILSSTLQSTRSIEALQQPRDEAQLSTNR